MLAPTLHLGAQAKDFSMKDMNDFRLVPKNLAVAAALLVAPTVWAAPTYTPGTYQLDAMHSKVGFEVSHLVIATVEGRFTDFQGELVLAPKVDQSTLNVTIKTASIDTSVPKRDDHLRSADFFDATKYPEIIFKSKKISGSLQALRVVGDFTMHGVTREVTLDAKYLGEVKDGYGNLKVAFDGKTKIKREDFGLKWSSMVEAGPVVGSEVTIDLKVQAAPKK